MSSRGSPSRNRRAWCGDGTKVHRFGLHVAPVRTLAWALRSCRERTGPATRIVATAEHQQEELEDVEYVEEDARRDRDRVVRAGAAQPLEVVAREAAKDDEAGAGDDDVGPRDRNEQRCDREE